MPKLSRRAKSSRAKRRITKSVMFSTACIGIALCVGRSLFNGNESLLAWLPEDLSLSDWLPEEYATIAVKKWLEIPEAISLRWTSRKDVTTPPNATTNKIDTMMSSNETAAISDTQVKIIGFSDAIYRNIATFWYERMTRLGYKEHTIIATDQAMADFLVNHTNNYRFETMNLPQLEGYELQLNRMGRARRVKEIMFGQRWNFILEQLERGISIVLTDVDNIFNKHIPLSDFMNYDVIHAYENNHPVHVYQQQGFVVCGGMSWIKASPAAIRFVKKMVERCPRACDDQVVLNELIAEMNITWDNTDHLPPPENTLASESMTGVSKVTGHSVKVWERDFAYRGELFPKTCPANNWVSMPFPYFPPGRRVGRWNVHKFKLQMFDHWDRHCNVTLPSQS